MHAHMGGRTIFAYLKRATGSEQSTWIKILNPKHSQREGRKELFERDRPRKQVRVATLAPWRAQSCRYSFAACINNDEHAFLWDNGTMLDLNTFVHRGSVLTLNEAVFINDRGVISGFATNADGEQRFSPDSRGSGDTAGCKGTSSTGRVPTRVSPPTVQAPRTATSNIRGHRGSDNQMIRPFGRRLMPLHR
jgi:hypothetical protein